MELKVWVEGVVRVVSGLSLNTSSQDVVIALAQSIGQTGRYILILNLRGNERHLVAEECPLQHLAQLGQLAADVQFILRRTGPSLHEDKDAPSREKRLPLPRPTEPERLKRKEPQKSLSFSLGPTTTTKMTKPAKAWAPSPRDSPEPRASPVGFLDPPNSSKDEVFRQILHQQRKLQDLEIQLQALEREAELWERERSSASALHLDLDLAEELNELELQLRQNEAELVHREHWEQQLQAEMERERDMQRRLNQIHSSIDDHSYEIRALQTRSTHLEKDLQARDQTRRSQVAPQPADEALRPLKQELLNRLQLGEELDSGLWDTREELQTAEERVKDRLETIEELNKELRQCKLQQFIQQTGITPHAEQTSPPPSDVYLSNAGILE